MTISLGDLAQSFLLQQRSAQLRTEITTLSQELTTGLVADSTNKLKGDFSGLAGLEHRLGILDSARITRSDTSRLADAAQLNLTRMIDTVGDLGQSLLSLGTSPTVRDLSGLDQRVFGAFESTLASLNASSGDRAIFSGTATDTPPLPSAEDFLIDIRSVVGGATTAAQVWADLTSWFDDPSGFSTVAYRGSAQALAPLSISADETVSFQLRADDPAFRSALRDLAAAVIATDASTGLSDSERAALRNTAGGSMLMSQDALIGESAGLGVLQERIDIAGIREETERLTLQMARAELINADPYDAATKLEAAQFQLEALYSLT